MSLKSATRRFVGGIGWMPVVSPIVRRRSIRRIVERVPVARAIYGSEWERPHPFDRAYGTDTSGFAPAENLPAGERARANACFYAGSQPSILRTALKTLEPLESSTFVDLGCGKGRALLVASEFPFQDILGIELSPHLAEIARRNAAVVARRFPSRPAVRIAVGDATAAPLPAGDLVLYLYHPFGAELVAKVAAAVEVALAVEQRTIHVVYYNPVAGHCFDASPRLRRRFASMVPYGSSELGFGPDRADPLIIWEGGNPSASFPTPPNARIVVDAGGMRATLEGA
jgi:SAM-dependent methyltransferase